MKRLFKFIFSKPFVISLLAVVQIVLFYLIVISVRGLSPWVYLAMVVLSVAVLLYLFEADSINPSYKLSWVVFMIVFPVTGALFYRLFGSNKLTRKERARLERSVSRARNATPDNTGEIERITARDRDQGKQATFLSAMAVAPPYGNTSARYYSTGDEYFSDMLDDLEKARETVFIQSFIIEEGYIWNRMVDILKAKAARGVDVRVIYDGFGCLMKLPSGYARQLEEAGIKTRVFNDAKFTLHLGSYMRFNHRDHRKQVIIDSTVAYGGGMNIADEYANVKERFGVWKDSGFRLEGEGVFGMTSIFLQSWEFVSDERDMYSSYRPKVGIYGEGYVQPYHDVPMDRLNVCKNVYISTVNNANRYVYFTTPYLAIDYEFIEAIKLAGQSGIDVRIIVPGVPDKWYVMRVTRSYYRTLTAAGVRIYEYTPGFMHSKIYVADDSFAVVGSCNTDYRSMYLNYENCCAFYDSSIVGEVKKDFIETLDHCHEITKEDIDRRGILKEAVSFLLRVFAPMM